MAFTIPNDADAFHTHQAGPDSVDFAILAAAMKGDGVLTGLAVTAQGTPDMTVAVAAGWIAVGGVLAQASAGNVNISAADATNPRFDLISVDNTGGKNVTAGTPAATPVFPAIPADSVVIAVVYVPANDTDIESDHIVDKRCFVTGAGISSRVYRNGTQSITTGAFPTCAYDAEDYDNLKCHDNATNNDRLIAPVAGNYRVTAQVHWQSNATGKRQIFIRRSGDSMVPAALQLNPDDALDMQMAVSGDLHLDAGQYVEIVVSQNSGTTLTIGTASSPQLNQHAESASLTLLRAD